MQLLPSFIALSASLVAMANAAPASNPIPFTPGFSSQSLGGAPLAHLESQPTRKHIQDSYMVVLKDGVSAQQFFAHRQLVSAAQTQASAFHSTSGASTFGLGHIYDLEGHFQGYAGKFSPDVLTWIRAQPEVDYVEQDTVVTTQEMPPLEPWAQQQNKIDVNTAEYDTGNITTQKSAPWGLARISHRKELGFGTFNKYVYDGNGGEGVTAYIIDTGIYIKHEEFQGRARWGKTMPQNDVDEDGNGHGTHCAGTIGSRAYGVAKKADLVAVKVLGSGGSGSMSDVTGGVLWAVDDAKKLSAKYAKNPSSKDAKKHKGFVANMSLGGGKSPSLDKAVNGAVSSGLHFGVAAGNENQDACNTSPAGASNPVTVGASTIEDERAYFSNKGKCVDIFAPGLNIKSTWNNGKDNTISGTSMASPHIVGLLAYLLSVYGTESFQTIKDALPVPSLYSEEQTLSVSDASESLADTLAGVLPLPAMALDAIHAVSEWFSPSPKVHAHSKPYVMGSDILSVLSPSDMKKALINLATPGILKDLDSDTVNKLAFNNATSV